MREGGDHGHLMTRLIPTLREGPQAPLRGADLRWKVVREEKYLHRLGLKIVRGPVLVAERPPLCEGPALRIGVSAIIRL